MCMYTVSETDWYMAPVLWDSKEYFIYLILLFSVWFCRGSEYASPGCASLACGLFWTNSNYDPMGSKLLLLLQLPGRIQIGNFSQKK